MGCGSEIKEVGRKIDDNFIQPVKKTVDGTYVMEGLNSIGVLSDGGLDEFHNVRRTLNTGAMAIGGAALAPMTGGASLGMTYGALSGAGLAAMNGADWNQAMRAGQKGGVYGAVGGGAAFAGGALATGAGFASGSGTGITGLASGAGSTGIPLAGQAGQLAGTSLTYGVSGYGGARGAGMSSRDALLFGAGSALGGYAGVGRYGATASGGMLGAAALGGMGLMSAAGGEPQPDGGGGGGGGYQAPQSEGSGDPNAGGKKQSRGKSVPEAQFLDGGGSQWGNAGMGGMFGGLDNLRKKDKFINTDEIKNLYAQRGVGAFVK